MKVVTLREPTFCSRRQERKELVTVFLPGEQALCRVISIIHLSMAFDFPSLRGTLPRSGL